jgi:hypothetical protein
MLFVNQNIKKNQKAELLQGTLSFDPAFSPQEYNSCWSAGK